MTHSKNNATTLRLNLCFLNKRLCCQHLSGFCYKFISTLKKSITRYEKHDKLNIFFIRITKLHINITYIM